MKNKDLLTVLKSLFDKGYVFDSNYFCHQINDTITNHITASGTYFYLEDPCKRFIIPSIEKVENEIVKSLGGFKELRIIYNALLHDWIYRVDGYTIDTLETKPHKDRLTASLQLLDKVFKKDVK